MTKEQKFLEKRIAESQKTGTYFLENAQKHTTNGRYGLAAQELDLARGGYEHLLDELLPDYKKLFPSPTSQKKNELDKIEADTQYNLAQCLWESANNLQAQERNPEANVQLSNAIEYMRLSTSYYTKAQSPTGALDCILNEARYTHRLVENLMDSKEHSLAETRTKDIISKQLSGSKLQRFESAHESEAYKDILEIKADLLMKLGFTQKALRKYDAANQTFGYSYKTYKALSEHPLHTDADEKLYLQTKEMIKAQQHDLQQLNQNETIEPTQLPPPKRGREQSYTQEHSNKYKDIIEEQRVDKRHKSSNSASSSLSL